MRVIAIALLSALAASLQTPQAYAATVLSPAIASIDLLGYTSSAGYSNLSSSPQTYVLTDSISTISGGGTLGLTPEIHGGINIAPAVPRNPYPDPYNMGQVFDSEAFIYYQFAVNGPANQQVAINLSSSGTATVSTIYPTLNATAYLNVYNSVDNSVLLTAQACAGAASVESDPCDATTGPLTNTFTVNRTLTVTTNTPYWVNLYASNSMAAPDSGISGNFDASSSVDPTITLDTTDPAFTLQFSPNLQPSPATAATPEPESIALVLTGIPGLAITLRRRYLAS